MGIFDLFSKRQRRLRGEVPDVYSFDEIPQPLRVQVVHIVQDALGKDRAHNGVWVSNTYKLIHKTLCREYGVFQLIHGRKSSEESVINFFLQEESVEKTLDVIELFFRVINGLVRGDKYRYQTKREIEPDDAIQELNQRFQEHGIGYQFESNDLIRVDSKFLHAEAVKPALTILAGAGYKGANDEFLKAHEHYRHGRYKECLVDSLKSFESTMTVICTQRGWPFSPTDTAKALINTCLSNGLLPSYLESQMGALRSLLESGVPTVRNKVGGHGQGTDLVPVPAYMARYALNLTASTILFMVEAASAES